MGRRNQRRRGPRRKRPNRPGLFSVTNPFMFLKNSLDGHTLTPAERAWQQEVSDAHMVREPDFAAVAALVKAEEADGTAERWFDGKL